MKVTVHRLSDFRYFSTAVRDDGVTVRIPGFDRAAEFPHDLAHFMGERELGMTRGFWGSVAAGAMFTPGMTVVDGRRKPHADERSKQILKANADQIGVSEFVAAAAHDACAHGETAEQALAKLARAWYSRNRDPMPITLADVSRVLTALQEVAERWAATPEGGTLELDWDLPVDQYGLQRHRRDRARRR
jgi:hypothetical protein